MNAINNNSITLTVTVLLLVLNHNYQEHCDLNLWFSSLLDLAGLINCYIVMMDLELQFPVPRGGTYIFTQSWSVYMMITIDIQ